MEIYKSKIKICVSGAAETGHCSETALKVTTELGQEIAKHDCIMVTGATTGTPFWAAKGAIEAGGMVVGFSPAATEKEHLNRYKLPIDFHQVIMYTGSGFAGRNLQLTRSSDAVIIVCGRIGTLNEFTVAFEDEKPIGVLEGTGGTADMIREIVNNGHHGPGKIVYEKDPKKLVEKVMELVKIDQEGEPKDVL